MSNITSAYMKDVNRLKLVLVEQKRTGKWLAEQLGKDPSTVSKWCSNVTQPTLDILVNIAKVLNIDVKDLKHLTDIIAALKASKVVSYVSRANQ